MELFGSASSLQGFPEVLKRQDGAARAAKLPVPRARQTQLLLAHEKADPSRAPLDHHSVAGRLEEPESPKDLLAISLTHTNGNLSVLPLPEVLHGW